MERCPIDTIDLATFDPFDPAVLARPELAYAAMRQVAPVFKVPGQQVFLVTRYSDVLNAVRDTATFSNQFKSPGTALGSGGPEIQAELAAIRAEGYPQVPTLLTSDAPAHTRYRRLVSRAFTPKRVASWRPRIEQLAEELIDGFAAAGEVELVEQFAVPLPVGVIAHALGVPADKTTDFKQWTNDSTDTIGAAVTDERRLEAARGLVDFQHYFAAELEERRHHPRDDFLCDLVQATIDDDANEDLDDRRPLDVPEMLSILHQLLVAGNETTTSLIAEAMRLLAGEPAQVARVAGEPDKAALVVEEALRLAAPAQGMFRVATRDTSLSGVSIPAGGTVILLYASANRDDAVFETPDAFCPERANARQHLSFGLGTHFCVGASLSRSEAEVALSALCRRLANPRLDARFEVSYKPSFVLRGPRAMHLLFDPPPTDQVRHPT